MPEFPRDSNKIRSISFALEKLDPQLCRGRYQMLLLCYSANCQSPRPVDIDPTFWRNWYPLPHFQGIQKYSILIQYFGEIMSIPQFLRNPKARSRKRLSTLVSRIWRFPQPQPACLEERWWGPCPHFTCRLSGKPVLLHQQMVLLKCAFVMFPGMNSNSKF